MGRSLILHLVIIQVFGVGVVAWAGSDRRESVSTQRFDARDQSKVTVRGELQCLMPEENTGQACTLQLAAESGETFKISAHNSAMRLYHDGKTQVVATGTVIGKQLRITNIRSD